MIRSLIAVALLARVAHADTYTCHEPAADSKITVVFKSDVSIYDLTAWVTGFTCKAVLVDSGVAQHLTKLHIAAPKPLTPKQALQLFVDAIDATGYVVDVKADTIVIKRNPKLPQGCPDAIASADAPVIVAPASAPEVDELTAEIDKGIVVVDDTHRKITRALVDKILANPMAISKGARIVPAVKDGKPDGFKLYAIRPSSLYARLGLQNGDTVTAVNGFPLTSADRALEVYTKLREATSLELDVTRRGKATKLVITITP